MGLTGNQRDEMTFTQELAALPGAICWGIIGYAFSAFIVSFYDGMRHADIKREDEYGLRKGAYHRATLFGAAIFAFVWYSCHVRP